MGKLIIDGNSVYELDDACMRKKRDQHPERKDDSREKDSYRDEKKVTY